MRNQVEIQNKFLLTFEEASKYFGIGENKLRNMADIAQNPTWVVQNGCRRLIKRVLFEKFLLDAETI